MIQEKERCRKLKVLANKDVFPDRQVVAMTGYGTNSALALMGIEDTQIAKDAANIILLDTTSPALSLRPSGGGTCSIPRKSCCGSG